MAAPESLHTFGLADLKARKVLTDPAGGPATYGPYVDLPGQALMTPAITAGTPIELRDGCGTLLTSKSGPKTGTVNVTFRGFNFDAMVLLSGAVYVADETTPGEEVYRATIMADSDPGYIELSGISCDADGNATGFVNVAHKVQLTNIPVAPNPDNAYSEYAATGNMVPLATGEWFTSAFYATRPDLDALTLPALPA